jgi:large subunit ribosomal protein L4
MDEVKTKKFMSFLTAVGFDGKALVVTPEVRDNVIRSARNIPGVSTTIARKGTDDEGREICSVILSAYDVMNCKKFIIDEAALKVVEEVYA